MVPRPTLDVSEITGVSILCIRGVDLRVGDEHC
jgi:hypothetical protein